VRCVELARRKSNLARNKKVHTPSDDAKGVRQSRIKLLPNGHFLINFSGANPDGLNSIVQEIDLAGTVVWQMTAAQLNSALATSGCAGCNITVIGTHHDFAVLPNGHIVFIAALQKDVSEP
jgi:hypothetical protein